MNSNSDEDISIPNPSEGTAETLLSSSFDTPTAIQLNIPGYQLRREISRGGQAVVYESKQESTGRRVAVKVLHNGAFASSQQRSRFEREVKILASIDHPGVVQAIDRGQTNEGLYYLVMNYVEGQTLDNWLRGRSASSDPSACLELFMSTCDAVNAAHVRGIVHRDIKPSNIVIDEYDRPHVLDFGLARAGLSEQLNSNAELPVTITGQFLGSLPWASPEQAEGKTDKIDCRTDVYSLGVVLYQMLTGSFPYEVVGTMRDVLHNIVSAEPTPPSTALATREYKETKRRKRRGIVASINPIIEAIVLKALAKRRADRYQNAGELARDIANYLSGRPTIAGGKPELRIRIFALLPSPNRLAKSTGVAITATLAIFGILVITTILTDLDDYLFSKVLPISNHNSTPDTPRDAGAPSPADPGTVIETSQDIDSHSNSVGMMLVTIAPGDFMQGSPPDEAERFPDETQRLVTISRPFDISATEVTVGQWRSVMHGTHGTSPDESLPATGISRSQMKAFCERLSLIEGRQYRLPTEAEWEYACRAGSNTAFNTGKKIEPNQGNYHSKYSYGGSATKTPRLTAMKVGSFAPNAWGLYDMHGNVWEVVADNYSPYGHQPATDPFNKTNPGTIVARGGGFQSHPLDSRSSRRLQSNERSASRDLGFRVVADQ